jgi:hypothetical protein
MKSRCRFFQHNQGQAFQRMQQSSLLGYVSAFFLVQSILCCWMRYASVDDYRTDLMKSGTKTNACKTLPLQFAHSHRLCKQKHGFSFALRHRRMMKDPMDKFKVKSVSACIGRWVFGTFAIVCILWFCRHCRQVLSVSFFQAPMTESMNIGWHEEEVRLVSDHKMLSMLPRQDKTPKRYRRQCICLHSPCVPLQQVWQYLQTICVSFPLDILRSSTSASQSSRAQKQGQRELAHKFLLKTANAADVLLFNLHFLKNTHLWSFMQSVLWSPVATCRRGMLMIWWSLNWTLSDSSVSERACGRPDAQPQFNSEGEKIQSTSY